MNMMLWVWRAFAAAALLLALPASVLGAEYTLRLSHTLPSVSVVNLSSGGSVRDERRGRRLDAKAARCPSPGFGSATG